MFNVEEIIREAMARGEFDNLAGAGKPLDLSAYFETPEDLRLAYSTLKNANILPREAELLKEIAALKEAAEAENDLAKRGLLRKQIENKRLEFNLMMERQKREGKPKNRS